jgi:hypothetical protein
MQLSQGGTGGDGTGMDGGVGGESNPNLTFRPQTNKVKRSMVSARNYLKQNWVDRLSKPHPAQVGALSDGEGDDHDHDGDFSGDSGGDKENGEDDGGNTGRSRGRQSSTPMPYTRRTSSKNGRHSQRPSSAPPAGRHHHHHGKGNKELTNEEKRAIFKQFWHKQKTRSDQQKKRLEKSRIKNT